MIVDLDNHLSYTRIIKGILKRLSDKQYNVTHQIVIYNAMKKERKPHFLNVKYEVKSFYYQEKYRHYIKDSRAKFEKQYSLLVNFCDNDD